MIGYKFVRENLKSEHGDIQWAPGEWQKCEGELSLCKNGLHASQKPLDSLDYTFGTRWFECEARGILKGSDKFCASEMRLLQEIPKEVLIQFAIDCAKKVLLVFEKEYPNNKQLRKVVKAAELYLKNPNALTCDAARTAYTASKAAYAAREACEAAWAAWATYNDWDAMKKWQNRHLLNLIRKEGK